MGFGISGNFTALELLKSGVFNLDVRGTLELDYNFGVELNFSGFAQLGLRGLNVYAGPTVSILLGYGFGATVGIRSPVETPVGFLANSSFCLPQPR